MVEETVRPAPTSLAASIARGGGPGIGASLDGAPRSFMGAAQSVPRPITEIEAIAHDRSTTCIGEFDRVLGGGVVPGSLVLIGGDPGIGKSTLLTQVAGNVAREHGTTLYVSGEESVEQIKMRAGRLGSEHPHLLLASETDVAQVPAYVQKLKPRYLIIDSIQTMQSPYVDSAPGTVSQVRASCAALAAIACSSKVDLPMPGSPPSNTTPPDTSPPPRTRSNSSIPVGVRALSWVSTLASVRTALGAPASAWKRDDGVAAIVSTSVFHTTQFGHCPCHLLL